MWFILLPQWFLVNVLAYLLAPILPLFAEWRYGYLENSNAEGMGFRLPVWLSYFDTPDNALTGDYGHRERTAGTSEYWSMVLWLWRNPAVGYEHSVLNAKINSTDKVVVEGDPEIRDRPTGRGGYCFVRVGPYWNYVLVKQIASRCLYVNLGWNLKAYAEDPSRLATQPTARYVLSVRLPIFEVK